MANDKIRFEIWLTPKELKALQARAKKMIDPVRNVSVSPKLYLENLLRNHLFNNK